MTEICIAELHREKALKHHSPELVRLLFQALTLSLGRSGPTCDCPKGRGPRG
jgi:hypothetical protein